MGPSTNNCLFDAKDPVNYRYLAETLDLKIATWESARVIDQTVRTCDNQADWFDALVLAMHIIHENVESRTYDKKKIVLMTTFASTVPTVSQDTKQEVIEQIKKDIELIVM